MSGQIAVVTGAASGIGRATVHRLVDLGWTVHAVDVDAVGLEAVASTPSVTAHVVDLADESATQVWIAEVIGAGLHVDALINVAGIGLAADAVHTTDADWHRVLGVNLTAAFILSRGFVPQMIERSGGVIVNVASVAAVVGVANRVAYCAAKAGLVGLTRAMAADHASQGIRINAVCPGTVETGYTDKILDGETDADQVRQAMTVRQLVGRMGDPDEIAGVIAFLAGPDASFIHGASIVADGGMTVV
jgi:NAD(P)-dependent dehydrogenase (short-subunit alcohol dehydrogenase family)